MVRNKLEEHGRKQMRRKACCGDETSAQRWRGEAVHGHPEQRRRGETAHEQDCRILGAGLYRLQLEPKSHGAVIGCFRG